MIKQKLFDYYRFGYNFDLLLQGRKGFHIATVIDELGEFMQFIDSLNLEVTRMALKQELISFMQKLEGFDQSNIISDNDSSELMQMMSSIEKTLDAELQLRYAYILTDKRLGLSNLLEKIETIFNKDIFKFIPDLAKYDFEEAGKCLAFERPTSSAFHILRATEECLRFYYHAIVRQNKIRNLLWKNITDHLRTKRNIPNNLLDACDHVRINFRNPTAHPEAKYGVDDAQSLFSLCADIVNRIINDLKEKKKI